MEYQQVRTAIENNIGLVNYYKSGTLHTKFVAFDSSCTPTLPFASYVPVYNLITKSQELINSADVKCILSGSKDKKCSLYSSLIKSERKFNSLKSITQDPDILDSLTDHLNMVFINGLPLDVVLFTAETDKLLHDKLCCLKEFVSNPPAEDMLQYILEHLFHTNNFTVSYFKQRYAELLSNKSNTEIEIITTEWGPLTEIYPEICVNELQPAIMYIYNRVAQAKARFDKIKESRIQNNWGKLIQLAYKCWPTILQPNPFKLLTNL